MALKFKSKNIEEAELDVTAFMNLMIVLVPVMLLSLTFSQITVHEIKLPELAENVAANPELKPQLEVQLSDTDIKVFYPSKVLVKNIPAIEAGDGNKAHDFAQLSKVLQEVKQQLEDKRDILIMPQAGTDYQNLISAMDAAKSYKTLVAASVVEVELFPEISLAEAK